jgi:hypothetical protein
MSMKRFLQLGCAVCALLIGLMFLVPMLQIACLYTRWLYYDCTHPPPPSIPAAEQAAREQVDAALPLGSPIEEVEAWVNSQGGYHVKDVRDKVNLLNGAEQFGGRYYVKPVGDKEGPIIWSERTIYRGFMYNLELHREFYFDKDGKLTHTWLRVVSIGP